MRNLKKLISLLLVVAMIASLGIAGIFTASAAGEETTAYLPQAKIVQQAGIIQGYPDGTIGYQKPVTRAEAAAIVARAMLGASSANALVATEVAFTDVPAWASGTVAYLVKNNVINGRSETVYDPSGNVTGIEFAKMLLCALGYGKQGEYTGSSWDVNTLVDARSVGLFSGIYGVDFTAPATREQCMAYVFNALTSYKVIFDTRMNTYERYTNAQTGRTVTLGGIHGVSVDYDFDDFGRVIDTYTCGSYTLQIAETPVWTGTEMNSDVLYNDVFSGNKNVAEALGYARLWIDGERKVAIYIDDDNNYLEKRDDGKFYYFGSNKEYNGLYKDNANHIVYVETEKGEDGKDVTRYYYYDYVKANSDTRIEYEYTGSMRNLTEYTPEVVYDSFLSKVYNTEEYVNTIAGNGAFYEVYGMGWYGTTEYMRGDIDRTNQGWFTFESSENFSEMGITIVAYYEHVGKVTKVSTSKNGDVTYTLDTGDKITDNNLKASVDDYIIYTIGRNKGNQNPETAEIIEPKTGNFTGTITVGTGSHKETGYIIDGKTYFLSDAISKNEIDPDSYGEYTYVLDSQGYIARIELKSVTAADYLYVRNVDSEVVTDAWKPFSTNDGGVAILAVFGNGGSDTLYFNVKHNSTGYYITPFGGNKEADKYYLRNSADLDEVEDAIASGWYGYTIDNAGYVTLSKLKDNYASVSVKDVTIDDDGVIYTTPNNDKKTATSSTVLYVVDKNGSVTKRTGYTRFKEVSGKVGNVLYTYGTKGTDLYTIYVYVEDAAAATTDSYCYLSEVGMTTADGTEYTFIMSDGTEKKVTMDATLYDGYIYNLTVNNKVYSAELVTEGITSAIWYDVNEEHLTGDKIPQPKFTIGTVEKDYIITARYNANGQEVPVETYKLGNNYSIVDTTDSGVKALEVGQGFIAHYTGSGDNKKIDVIWIVYVPETPEE